MKRLGRILPVLAAILVLLAACGVPLFGQSSPTTASATDTPFVLPTLQPPVETLAARTSSSLQPTGASQGPTLTPLTGKTTTATQSGSTIDLRAVNWNAFLAAEPDLNHPTIQPLPLAALGPYVETKNSTPQNTIGGYAMTDGILYLDFSGDGKEEAVISLYSGGTGGNFGLLIYRAGATKPELVTALGGYKLGASADGNLLLVREPVYAGWEPNCCNSGFKETRYRLQAGALTLVSRRDYGVPEMKRATVERLYDLLQQKDYRTSYTNFSPAFQARWPFDQWVAGYKNTQAFTVQTSDLSDGTVAVDLIAIDSSLSGPVTKHFQGAWALIWSSTAKQWLLDVGQLRLLP